MNGKILVSDELDTLLLKRDQSVDERKPLAAADDCNMERVLPLNESGPVIPAEVTPPVPFPVRRPPRVVEPVPPKKVESEVVPETAPPAPAKRRELVMPVILREGAERAPVAEMEVVPV